MARLLVEPRVVRRAGRHGRRRRALPRDSVGARQIRTDAVRSPEIKKDAVRSSEIRDQGINFGDVSTGAATKLRGELFFAEDDNDSRVPVPECDPDTADLSVCPNFLVLNLGSGGTAQPDRNWLIKAKADVDVDQANEPDENLCGLVNTAQTGPKAVLDQVGVYGVNEDLGEELSDQAIALSAVVKTGRQSHHRPALHPRGPRTAGRSGGPGFRRSGLREVRCAGGGIGDWPLHPTPGTLKDRLTRAAIAPPVGQP